MRSIATLIGLSLIGVLLAGTPSMATTEVVVLNSANIAYWRTNGAYCPNLPFSGSGNRGGECRTFMMFDLADIGPGTITSAFLSMEVEGFWSSVRTECLAAYDAADSAIDDLLDGVPSRAIFEDLGDGESYSDEICLTYDDMGSIIEVPLSPAALAELNATDRYFPIGFPSTTVDGSKDESRTEGVRFGKGDIARFTNKLVLSVRRVLTVELDIKPGNESNSVKLGRGKIPVAILGSETFDVEDIDAETLAFGPEGASPAHKKQKKAKKKGKNKKSKSKKKNEKKSKKKGKKHHGGPDDVNDDGFRDLVVHFRASESGILPGDVEACITGETLDGSPFEGCDLVTTPAELQRARRSRPR